MLVSFRLVSLLVFVSVLAAPMRAQVSGLREAAIVPGRLVVVYREGAVPEGGRLKKLGMDVLAVAAGTELERAASLRRDPRVLAVLQDRRVEGHVPVKVVPVSVPLPVKLQTAVAKVGQVARIGSQPVAIEQQNDPSYTSPAGWAVKGAGGYGAGLAGGNLQGPWNLSLGAGVRIAVLDSGVDAAHPDIAGNLVGSMSEVDQVAMPSACDDGTPQDQQGHGTWVASLAAAAMGYGTGETIGVAPQASLLNIKVLERVPGTGATATAQCEAGQPSGLLSWVLAGINDAVAARANVIVLSLGSLVDVSTGDGAGWKSAFDRATYAADQAGVVVVAAVGNDGLNLSSGKLMEMPAQARGVVAVTASTNPACAENLAAGATCVAGPVTRAYYSNYGVDGIAAPGGSYPEGVDDLGVSGWIRGACSAGVAGTQDGLPANGASFGCFGLGHVQYMRAMGTSAAAPLVAGAAALLHAVRPDLSADGIVALLKSSGTHTGSMTEPVLNLAAALGLR